MHLDTSGASGRCADLLIDSGSIVKPLRIRKLHDWTTASESLVSIRGGSGSIWELQETSGSSWEHLEAPVSIWNLFEAFGSFWMSRAASGTFWSICEHLDHSGTLWMHDWTIITKTLNNDKNIEQIRNQIETTLLLKKEDKWTTEKANKSLFETERSQKNITTQRYQSKLVAICYY